MREIVENNRVVLYALWGRSRKLYHVLRSSGDENGDYLKIRAEKKAGNVIDVTNQFIVPMVATIRPLRNDGRVIQ